MKLALTINWKITAFSLLFLPLLLSLGFWQLSRAQEKRTLQQTWRNEQAQPPVQYRDALKNKNSVRRVFLNGQFDPSRYWLIENKILNGQLGYQVVMPFKTLYNDWVLINRGWVAAAEYRNDNPKFSTSADTQRLTGTLKSPSDSRFIGQSTNEQVTNWPHRLLEIDVPMMSEQFGEDFQQQVVLIDADSANALAVKWQPINMTAERHQGYAVQWFAMAFALCVLWVITNTNVYDQFRGRKNNGKK